MGEWKAGMEGGIWMGRIREECRSFVKGTKARIAFT